MESLRLTRVLFDPVIAALLGQAFGVEKFYGVTYVPRIGARHHSGISAIPSVSLSYDRSVLAGNGVYTTAGYELASVGYTYTRHTPRSACKSE